MSTKTRQVVYHTINRLPDSVLAQPTVNRLDYVEHEHSPAMNKCYLHLLKTLEVTGSPMLQYGTFGFVGASPYVQAGLATLDIRVSLGAGIRDAYLRGMRTNDSISIAAQRIGIERVTLDRVLHHGSVGTDRMYQRCVSLAGVGPVIKYINSVGETKVDTMFASKTVLTALPPVVTPPSLTILRTAVRWAEGSIKVGPQLERIGLGPDFKLPFYGVYDDGYKLVDNLDLPIAPIAAQSSSSSAASSSSLPLPPSTDADRKVCEDIMARFNTSLISIVSIDRADSGSRIAFEVGKIKFVAEGDFLSDSVFEPELIITVMDQKTRIMSTANRTGVTMVVRDDAWALETFGAAYSGRSPFTHLPNSYAEVVTVDGVPGFSRSNGDLPGRPFYDPSILAPRFFNPPHDYAKIIPGFEWNVESVVAADQMMRGRLYDSPVLAALASKFALTTKYVVDTLCRLIEGCITRGDDFAMVLDVHASGDIEADLERGDECDFRIPSWTLASVLASTSLVDPAVQLVDGRYVGIRGREKSARESLVPPVIMPVDKNECVTPVYTFTAASWSLFGPHVSHVRMGVGGRPTEKFQDKSRSVAEHFLVRLGKIPSMKKGADDLPTFVGAIEGGFSALASGSPNYSIGHGSVRYDARSFLAGFAVIIEKHWLTSTTPVFCRTFLGSFIGGVATHQNGKQEVIIMHSPRYRVSTTTSRTQIVWLGGRPIQGLYNDIQFSNGPAFEMALAYVYKRYYM